MSVAAAPPASGDGGGISVKGGSRGLTVEYRELRAAGEQLERIAERLRDTRTRGVFICLRLYGLQGAPALPASAGRAADAVDSAAQSLSRNIADLEEAAASLRKAVENYLEVEGRLEQSMKAVSGAAPLTALMFWSLGGWGRPSLAVPELLGPRRDSLAAGLFGLPGLLATAELPSLTVSKVPGTHGKVTAPRTAYGLLKRSRILLEADSNAHVVEILTIHQDGQDVRVVTLPGTEGDPSLEVGVNPFDTLGNAEARARDSRYVADAVAAALRQAGASADDAVILVGYSQGGIHAVNTGARLAEDGEFTVEMVLTAGAPAGDRNVPEGIKMLHLEHGLDMVPGLDGSSNPDTPDRITVTGSAPVPDGGGPLGPAHELDVYLEMAAQADASSDPSLTEMLGHLAQVIGSGRVAARSLYKFSRKSDEKPPPRPPGRPVLPGNGLPLPSPGQVPPVLVKPVAPVLVPPAPPIPVPPVVPPIGPRGW
jgi:pimeloyl-ACP methyl ester carboxylesterase